MTRMRIGALELPVFSCFDLQQEYEPLGGENIMRAMTGRGIKQSTWKKTRVVTQASGWIPAGLNSLDFNVPHQVDCVAEVIIPASFNTRQVILPTTRRSDGGHLPWGLAQLTGGAAVVCPVSVVGDLATVSPVAGAEAYMVGYYPSLLCWVLTPRQGRGGDHSWQLTCEEV